MHFARLDNTLLNTKVHEIITFLVVTLCQIFTNFIFFTHRLGNKPFLIHDLLFLPISTVESGVS